MEKNHQVFIIIIIIIITYLAILRHCGAKLPLPKFINMMLWRRSMCYMVTACAGIRLVPTWRHEGQFRSDPEEPTIFPGHDHPFCNTERYDRTTSLDSQWVENLAQVVSSGGLAVKHPAFGANGHRFEPRKRSKLFQGLISRLPTSWVADHVKWRCRLHLII